MKVTEKEVDQAIGDFECGLSHNAKVAVHCLRHFLPLVRALRDVGITGVGTAEHKAAWLAAENVLNEADPPPLTDEQLCERMTEAYRASIRDFGIGKNQTSEAMLKILKEYR